MLLRKISLIVFLNFCIYILSAIVFPPLAVFEDIQVGSESGMLVSDNPDKKEASTSSQIENDLTIQTDNASSSADLINFININSIGNDFDQAIINILNQNHMDIDVEKQISEIAGINNVASSPAVFDNVQTASNTADLRNDIILFVSTGENSVAENVNLNANIFNLVNANLIGNSWFFNIINLFKNQKGNIILPYEFDYLKAENESSLQSGNFEIVNTNRANVSSNVVVETNTGQNAEISSNIFDVVNTNIVGDQWLFLQINNFAKWDGELIGWWGDYHRDSRHSFAWGKLNDEKETAINKEVFRIKNINDADVENNIFISASPETGSILAKTNIFDLVNTNIVGNHWYFSMINVFDDFIGDIIFPRPDLTITVTASKDEALPHEEIIYRLGYKNQGNLAAQESRIVNRLPPATTFISATDGAVYEDGQIVWQLGEIKPGQEGDVYLTLKADAGDLTDKIINTARISTTTFEINQTNNVSTVIVFIKKISQETDNDKIDAGETLSSPSPTTIAINSHINDRIVLSSFITTKSPNKKISKNIRPITTGGFDYLFLLPGALLLFLAFFIKFRHHRGD